MTDYCSLQLVKLGRAHQPARRPRLRHPFIRLKQAEPPLRGKRLHRVRVFADEPPEQVPRGSEIGADIVLKATKVDGVYTADPKKDPAATRFAKISFDEAIGRNLAVMDATAFALCRDQKLPINVFSIFKAGALKRVVMGEDEGTLVYC